jgi:hypothetical protein
VKLSVLIRRGQCVFCAVVLVTCRALKIGFCVSVFVSFIRRLSSLISYAWHFSKAFLFSVCSYNVHGVYYCSIFMYCV